MTKMMMIIPMMYVMVTMIKMSMMMMIPMNAIDDQCQHFLTCNQYY